MLLERPLTVGGVAGHEEVGEHKVRRDDIAAIAERLGEPRHNALYARARDPPQRLLVEARHVRRRVGSVPRAPDQADLLSYGPDIAAFVLWKDHRRLVDGAVLLRQRGRVANASLDGGDGLGGRGRGSGPPLRHGSQEREAVLGLVERDDRVLVRVGGRAGERVQQRRHRGLVA